MRCGRDPSHWQIDTKQLNMKVLERYFRVTLSSNGGRRTTTSVAGANRSCNATAFRPLTYPKLRK